MIGSLPKVYNETHKFIAVVNKDLEIGKALNAVAHACAGLVAMSPEEAKREMSFVDL